MDTDQKPILEGFGLCISAGARCNALSAIDRDDFVRLFRSWGLLMLRGFAPTIDDFKRFTDDTCQDFMTYRGGASARASVGGLQFPMTPSLLVRSAFLTTVTALAAVAFAAQPKSGWVSLFDGKTIDGWVVKGGTAKYHVEDGVIVGTSLKYGGDWANAVDPERVRRFVGAARGEQ